MTGTHLTERQELALRYEALISDVSVAELRRRAIASYADDLLDDPAVAEYVANVQAFRLEHSSGHTTLPTLAIGKPSSSHHSHSSP